LLTAYAPIKRWQRYAEKSYQRQPVYETAQMIELSNLQEVENDELITKFYIDIKNRYDSIGINHIHILIIFD
jgi:hypothetical protein